MRGDVGERQVGLGGAETIGKTSAVKEDASAVAVRDACHGLELGARVERARFGRVRDVDQRGRGHVVSVAVDDVLVEGGLDVARTKLAVALRKFEHLVAETFDGARLVNGNVTGLGGDHALPGLEHRADHRAVRLGPAGEKMNFSVGSVAGFADELRGPCRMLVRAVAGRFFKIRFREPCENLRNAALHIVGGKFKSCHCHGPC